MRVPFQDLRAAHARTAERTEAAVLSVLRSGQYAGGPIVEALEGAVAQRMGRAHGVAVSCGTEALVLALQVAGVRRGDEVIVPALSFVATLGAVFHAGAVPVVVDVLPDRPLLDPDLAAAAVTDRTRAIVPVHLFGDVASWPDVGVPIVDDAAQAIGVPTRGSLAALSFYPTKVLGGAGEGGMIVTDDVAQRNALRLLRNHGMARAHEPALVDGVVGKNARMDAIQAAILLARLDDLDASIAARREIAARYDRAFPGALPRSADSPVSSYVIRHAARDRLKAALHDAGIESQIYYPTTLAAFPGVRARPVPEAERFTRECLALPCHPALTPAQVDEVIAAVQAVA